jgi:hypothetical protein
MEMDVVDYVLISVGVKLRNNKKFRYGTPVHFEHY